MAVAAGVEAHLVMAAGRTVVDLAAQGRGAAGDDGANRAGLETGQRMLFGVGRGVDAQDVRQA